MPEVSSFDFARLAALKQYSDLEGELCLVLKSALRTDYDGATSVFYQVSNTRARYAIIGRLLRLRYEGAYRKAWAKIEKWLIPCDSARNQLVHWNESSTIQIELASKELPTAVTAARILPKLSNPAGNIGSPSHYEADIWARRDEMRVMMHIVNRFCITLEEPQSWPWTDIFQSPIVDLTPVEFLERLNDKGHRVQLPPYERKLLRRVPDV